MTALMTHQLKQAEVGIAVSNATDVAKAAASVVLTVEGLAGIVELVKIGRSTFQRIVTWILNKIVKTFEIAVFVTLAFLISALFWHNPIYAVSALDVTLFLFLIDFVTISLSTDNAKGSPTPEKWDVPKLVKLGIGLGGVHGCRDVRLIIPSPGLLPHKQHTCTTYLLLHGDDVHGHTYAIHS